MNPLAILSDLEARLVQAKSLDEIKSIRDMAEQARLYAQANKLGLDFVNHGAEIRLRADRRMGEVLILAKDTGEIKPHRHEKGLLEGTVKLQDVGISKKQSHITQQLARLPEQVFEQRIEETKATQKRLTTGAMLVKKEARQEKTAEIAKGNGPLPGWEYYPVIYADPPWQYEHSKTDNRQIENHYPTLDLESICTLGVRYITTEDAVLFLWATSPKLAEAMQVIEAWGFTYRTCMVWDKERVGMGYYARQQHELLLIAAKGKLPVPEPENRPPSVVRARRDNEHSTKPVEFYEIIERMYPEYPKVELFARDKREGWFAWGNQV